MPMSLFKALRSASLHGHSSISSSSKPDREYSPGLSQEAIDILENRCPSPDLTNPSTFRSKVPSPAMRLFAPVPSPLEHLVPYTAKTTLVTPAVAGHLNSKLASTPKEHGKYRHAGARPFFSKLVERLIHAIHPPLTGRHARLTPSTLDDIADYLSENNSEPGTHEVHINRVGGMSHEERVREMLVFDVFTTENSALRAFAIGPSPQSPLYIFYPLKHPYDEALLETLANRGDRICIYPPYIPEPDEIEEKDTAEEAGEVDKKTEKNSFWNKAFKKLCEVTKRKPIASQNQLTSIPLETLRPIAAGPVEPQVTYALSQSFLQFRDPLEGFRSETMSGIRWSSLWINQRLRNCLNDPPAPEPTEEELTEQARQTIRIACYEARLAKLTGLQKWFYELVHKRKAYKGVKIRSKPVGANPSGASQYTQHEAHKDRQDAGAMFIKPDITTPQDARVTEFILPVLDAANKNDKCTQDRLSHCSTDTGYSSEKHLSMVTLIKSQESATSGPEKPKITLQSKHPILRRDPLLPLSERLTRRPQTIHDLSTLIGHLKLTLPTLVPDESAFHTEFVIADEYPTFRPHKCSNELVGDEPGIQIFYEPPSFRNEAEKRRSGIEYISGRYLCVYKMTNWVVIYEWRKPSKRERRKDIKKEEKEGEEWEEEAQMTWGSADWKSRGEKLQKRLARGPLKNFGRVKLYTAVGSGEDLIGYLNLEKGQFSIRRDVTIENLHLAVLVMFSVVNLEEAVEKERQLLKTFEATKNLSDLQALPALNQKENPTTTNEEIQTPPKAQYPESGLQGPALQLFGTGETAEEFVIVGDNNTKTYFGSVGVQDLVRRATSPTTAKFDTDAESDSDSGSDGLQEIIRRTSRGWRRCSEDSDQRKFQPPQLYLI
ncbi:hypothetical protein L211DRAFT_853827 [Terfezia boudieri ATCC MYA-4762]|uniref:Uncharacterized protein n=1 Tax=Terfezia boudieri ATCC MYA-4762 TaxID=1051890 RepID=A0A3N4LLF4_9PEZI|nr:hypothetical protein L211DRAFT_853827 [Terfezia boudieri ATCC MYA-4762]